MATATTRTTWRRLKRNKGALFGIVVIALAVLVAIFAYLLAPDGSPDANMMTVEIGGQKPGYTQQFLLLPRERKTQPPSLLTRILYGAENKYKYIPISGYQATKHSLIIQQYIDEGIAERVSLPISQTRWQEGSSAGAYKIITKTFHLGTDRYGRDILSRLIVGVRVSLAVGLVTVLISLSIGVLLGALAGYFRGRTD